ncbi:MAG: preprotein translocase subunit SecA [Chloroflexi bacterium]|nr:preprotein translocase subunit SecA [Chloroflexota bacterium]MCY3695814.1 preprotein translocase subunit SecA [Chloroflexota bacterium]
MGLFDRAKQRAGSLIGDANAREVKRLSGAVDAVAEWEPQFERLRNDELAAKTTEFIERLEDGASLDDILPEAFAVVREAAKRQVQMRHYDVQIVGGIVLHQGKISEMRTGEGKTLVATLALYLNALEGDGAHLITVNDYLAKRDAQWMAPIYHSLGLSVGVLQHRAAFMFDPEADSTVDVENPESMDAEELQRRRELGDLKMLRPVTRQEAYNADITYGTNNEFGFDFLRDNMVMSAAEKVQRPLAFAIVDEVDNVLIDEARTPLIISGQAEESLDTYRVFANLVRGLRPQADFTPDPKSRTIALTEEGIARVEDSLSIDNLFEGENARLTRFLDAALKANFMYQRDRDYVVRGGKVVIVDEFTGRMMDGRRYSEGLHQAIEAKEGVSVERETVTLATITYQNYFRMYSKLAGMTGTAATEAEELHKIYGLDVVVIPTHRDMVRDDQGDLVFRTEQAKFDAAIEEIADLASDGRPVLVGTASVETSERLSTMLKRRRVQHEVLNAKQHEREAHIIAGAGEPGAVTIATNMAGRGTDIKLGEGVAKRGGLAVIGTERHESRRIDNQLRGRAGRQGDPGSSRFYVSFEDGIMKRFTPDWLPGMLEKAGLEDGTPLESGMVGKALEQAQQKVETFHFDIRKHLVDYDDVINRQREVIYAERDKILTAKDDLPLIVEDMLLQTIDDLEQSFANELWDETTADEFWQESAQVLPLTGLDRDTLYGAELDECVEALREHAAAELQRLAERIDSETSDGTSVELLRGMVLRTMDRLWIRHLTEIDGLRQGVGLQAYGQQDPLVTYKREAFDMFDQLVATLRREVSASVMHATVRIEQGGEPTMPRRRARGITPATREAPVRVSNVRESGGSGGDSSGGVAVAARPTSAPSGQKVGRNAPCPCGSGKKYKRCHGKAA